MPRTIIGIDHGYSNMKTAHTTFRTGLSKYVRKPAVTGGRVLRYGGRYYDLGGRILPVRRDRLDDEKLFVLTLGAAASELVERGLTGRQKITIAAGLPIGEFGEGKDALRSYLLNGGPQDGKKTGARQQRPVWQTELNGEKLDICIEDVKLYPQGYAAVAAHRPELLRQSAVTVLDMGGWTLDTLTIVDGVPSPGSARSFPRGMLACVTELRRRMEEELGMRLAREDVEAAVRDGQPVSTDPDICAEAGRMKMDWMKDTLALLDEEGLDPGGTTTVLVGGGAAFLKELALPGWRPGDPQIVYLDDVRANATGYEVLAAGPA